jgi:threonine dehydrogenase-like Zn-dependent dehydrogenase
MLDVRSRIGDTVLIFGQGVVGLLIAWMARKAGAGTVITVDPIEKRRKLSLKFGANVSVGSAEEEVRECVAHATGGSGADVLIEASGQPATLDLAIKVAAQEGRIVVASWYGTKKAPLTLGTDFHWKRLTIKSSQVSNIDPSLGPAWSIKRRRELAVRYLSDLDFDELITHRFPFERAAEAYRLIDEHPEQVVQVVLDYGG